MMEEEKMSEHYEYQSPIKTTYKGLGLAVGLIFGGFIGLLIGSPIIFAGGGFVLGFVIGAVLDSRNE